MNSSRARLVVPFGLLLTLASCVDRAGSGATPSPVEAAPASATTCAFAGLSGQVSSADGAQTAAYEITDGAPGCRLTFTPPDAAFPTTFTTASDSPTVDGGPVRLRDGDDAGVVCLVDEPAPDAPDCDDICFAELCLDAEQGIVSMGGLWAPEATPMKAVAAASD